MLHTLENLILGCILEVGESYCKIMYMKDTIIPLLNWIL